MSKNNESKRFPSSKAPYPPLLNPLVNQPHSQVTPIYPNGWQNTNRPTSLQHPSFTSDIPLPPNVDDSSSTFKI